MKKILLVLAIIGTIVGTVSAQSGDTLHVLAPSGLRLRSAASSSAPVVSTIPYGAAVFAPWMDGTAIEEEVDSIKGHWIKAEYQGKSGYIFDGYLSSLPAPTAKDTTLEAYAKAHFKKVGNAIEYAIDGEEDYYETTITYYARGRFLVSYQEEGFYESFTYAISFVNTPYPFGDKDMFLLMRVIFKKEITEGQNAIHAGHADYELTPEQKKDYYRYMPSGNGELTYPIFGSEENGEIIISNTSVPRISYSGGS